MATSVRTASGILLAAALVASGLLHVDRVLGGTWFFATALDVDVERVP